MGYFPKFQDRIACDAVTLSTAYQTVRKDIPRTKHLESIFIRLAIEMDIGTADNVSFTKLMDGLSNILKKVTFQANGHNYVNGVSGAGLLRYAANVSALDDRSVQAIAQGTTADTAGVAYLPDRGPLAALLMERALSHKLTVPLFFGHPQVMEPTTCHFYVPMPLFQQDGVLEMEFGKLAEIGTLGTGVTSMIVTPTVILNYRLCPAALPHWPHELNEFTETWTANGQKEFKLNSLGSYTGILLSTFNDDGVEAEAITTGDVQLVLGSQTIIKTEARALIDENSMSKASARGLFETASYYLDFLTDGLGAVAGLNSALDANPGTIGGSRFSVLTDYAAHTGSDPWTFANAKFLSHRIYGDLTPLKVLPK